MKNRKTAGALLSLLLGSLVVISADPAQKVKITRDGDVKVVKNPSEPDAVSGQPSRLSLREDLCIGRDPGDMEYVFADLRSIQVDDEGDIIALDWKDNLVKVFDSRGRHIRSFGKHGQGPGELQSPGRLYLQGGKRIAIMDGGNSRYALYSKAGECQKEFNMGQYRVFRTIPDSQGRVYGDQLIFDPTPGIQLLKISPDFSTAEVVVEFKYGTARGTLDVIFDRLTYGVFADDRFYWARSSKYQIHILDPEGREIRRVIKDYDPVRVTSEDKDKLAKEYMGVEKDRIPGEFPPLSYVLADDLGRLYVRTYEKDDPGAGIYDVFDPEGRFFTRLALPEEELLFVVKRGRAYCMINEDPEDGIPLIKRYVMGWK
jgi:hypothetical protein